MEAEAGIGPISASDAVRATVSYDQLRICDGSFYWLEARAGTGCGVMLVRRRSEGGVHDAGPANFSITSEVHTYGGGTYAIVEDELWCTGAAGLYRQHVGSDDLELMVPGIIGGLVVGAGEILAVRESEQGDELIAVTADGPASVRVLSTSPGFFGPPQPGPAMVAWSWWSEHDMPWDACELWVAPYESGGCIGKPLLVAGGADESVVEPRWGPDGSLYFVSDRNGWWNLFRWDGQDVHAVAAVTGECAAEPWELGYASYGFLDDGRIAVVVQQGPRHRLLLVDPLGAVTPVEILYTSIKPYVAVYEKTVALIASSTTVAPQVVLVHLASGDPRVEVLARSEHADLATYTVSTPAELQVPVKEGREVRAVVYPPADAGPGWRAPVIVRAHPGPTASCLLRLDWQAQFFTGRGFAVVDVDYLGSTGYGRAFRQALYGRWGLADVNDCRAVAEHLIATGRAVPGQVFIRGASAGGYTALHAVTHDGPFAAATAISAIVDPDRWAATVPRFQRAHALRLSGGAGRVAADAIRRPVLLVHGTDDSIATVHDVRELGAQLTRFGLVHDLLLLDDVGHYVASSVRAEVALEAELAHYLLSMSESASERDGQTAASGSSCRT
ncbi:S9 family peptidase [Micromonospora yangpuensis]|uniref:Dipeptidyl aminopeptidase/acylaminoacyl peptidase n=1 Tax=Micromonospora yangpuensis TaxID=683228 RepID=A0A1C6U3P7_9ACTN|nr:prolyl oligopeptidase family serine peptidase [Micromonospora yangpuensis]GGL93298.1 peptidase [Micromonospora yangpuensis]SCL48662.1 Dipeptidyl aminopeptidase/acylaminoacyl peptidase [Micromonospora yangpuensis]